jgi:hypothetical protein
MKIVWRSFICSSYEQDYSIIVTFSFAANLELDIMTESLQMSWYDGWKRNNGRRKYINCKATATDFDTFLSTF